MTLHFIYMLPCKTEESSIKVYYYEGNLRLKPISKLHINDNVCLLRTDFYFGILQSLHYFVFASSTQISAVSRA